jgi:hypothetical protein
MILPMKASLSFSLLTLLLPLAFFTTRISGETTFAPAGDDALRRTVTGTWLYEQNAGIASVAMYTTYREDGTAIQLIKTKIIFKKAEGVWIENRWSIQKGALHLTPVRWRAHSDDAKVEMDEAVRQLLSVDRHEMLYQLKGKERKESRVTGMPNDVQTMIDELSKK